MDLVNAVSEDIGIETTAYTYDANGNQITKITDDKTETYTYDGLNQLIGFTDGEIVASYAYNVDGQRIEKTVVCRVKEATKNRSFLHFHRILRLPINLQP